MKKETLVTMIGLLSIFITLFIIAQHFDKKLNAIEQSVNALNTKPSNNSGIKVYPTTKRNPIGFAQKPKIDTTIKAA
jgi:hypothetical protein